MDQAVGPSSVLSRLWQWLITSSPCQASSENSQFSAERSRGVVTESPSLPFSFDASHLIS